MKTVLFLFCFTTLSATAKSFESTCEFHESRLSDSLSSAEKFKFLLNESCEVRNFKLSEYTSTTIISYVVFDTYRGYKTETSLNECARTSRYSLDGGLVDERFKCVTIY